MVEVLHLQNLLCRVENLQTFLYLAGTCMHHVKDDQSSLLTLTVAQEST